MSNRVINKSLFILFCLVLSLGQLQRIELPLGLAIYLHELIMAFWLALSVITYPNKLKKFWIKLFKKVKNNQSFVALLILIGVGWITSFWQGNNLTRPLLYSLRFGFYISFIGQLFFLHTLKVLSAKTIRKWLLISGTLILWFGFLQYFFWPDTRSLIVLGWDDHYFRLISTILDPGFTGLIFVVTLFLLRPMQLNKLVKTALSLLLITGIFLTYSRASYLSLGVLIAALATQYRKGLNFKILTPLVVILIISLALLNTSNGGEGTNLLRTSTIQARISTTTASLSTLKPYQWIIGRGLFVSSYSINPPQLGSLSQPYHANLPDNSLLLILGGTGFAGLLLSAYLLSQYLYYLHKLQKTFLPILLAVLTHSLFSATLTYPFVLIFLGGSWLVGSKAKT